MGHLYRGKLFALNSVDIRMDGSNAAAYTIAIRLTRRSRGEWGPGETLLSADVGRGAGRYSGAMRSGAGGAVKSSGDRDTILYF
jgi:hypothetical protein